ncbi:MAG: Polyamine aminopropyltransferase [Turneriella sp.]|nr:Polyamine aminopropyltransferase [Turneriella sp.]
MFGLGGGILCRFLARQFSNLSLDVVEPDTKIIQIAKEHFSLTESSIQNLRIHQTDGRSYLNKSTQVYDMIILDAFDAIYIPADLMGIEFLRLVHSRLKESGVFIANTWVSPDLLPLESATYRYIFSPLYDIRRYPNTDGNRILLFNPQKNFYNSTKKNISHILPIHAYIRENALKADKRISYKTLQEKRYSLYIAAHKIRIKEITPPFASELIYDTNADFLRRQAKFE